VKTRLRSPVRFNGLGRRSSPNLKPGKVYASQEWQPRLAEHTHAGAGSRRPAWRSLARPSLRVTRLAWRSGAPDNGLCRYRRGAAEIPAGVSVTICLRHERLEKRHEPYLTPTVSGFQGRDRPSYQCWVHPKHRQIHSGFGAL